MKRVKKIRFVIGMLASIIIFSMVGCGKKNDESEDYKEMIYDATPFSFDEVDGEINSIVVKDNQLYINTVQWTEDSNEEGDEADRGEQHEDGELHSGLYSANIDGSDLKEIEVNMAENEIIRTILAQGDGTIICVVQSDNAQSEKESVFLVKIDKEGKELLRENITNILTIYESGYSTEFTVDEKGNVIAVNGQEVYIFDDDFNYIGEMNSPNLINGIGLTKDGQVICGSLTYDGDEVGAQVQVLDVEDRKWGKTITLENVELLDTDCIIDGREWDFYYRSDEGIYGYDIEKKKSVKLLDYIASNLDFENIYQMASFGDSKFISIAHDDDSNETGIVIYTKVDPATIPDKTIITYGGLYISDDIKLAASTFNRASREYQIEFKEYSNIEKMNTDIIAGKIPDIIDLNYQPLEEYVEKGILEDLTPYFDKDSELSTTDMIDSVRESMQINGKLYFVSPEFGVDTIIARVKDVGNRTNWTFDELKDFLDGQDDNVRLFYSDNKEDLLSIFLLYGSTDFIDWQTGKCSYDSQDFKEILQFCNKGTEKEENDTDYWLNMVSDIKEGKQLFVNIYGLNIGEIQVFHQMFEDDITYIGYPNMAREGSCFRFGTQIGISAQSEVKEGAWEFVRIFMTKEYQGNMENWMYGDASSPTRQDCFDMLVKAMTTTEAYTDELGQEVEPASGLWWWNDIEVDRRPLTHEEADGYINLVNNTNKRTSYDSSVDEIIKEEVKPYFAGEKSLDETVSIIQNRIQTYVSENR